MTRIVDVRLELDDRGVAAVGVTDPPANLAELLEQAAFRSRPKRGRGRPIGTTTLISMADVVPPIEAIRKTGYAVSLVEVAELCGVSSRTLERFMASYGLRFIVVDTARSKRPRSAQ